MRLVGLALIGIVVCHGAQAFQIDSRGGATSNSGQSNALTGQPPSDYRYSGNSFNFSMSRTPSPPNGAASRDSDDADRAAADKSRPGFFERIIHAIFGDD
jgi:hypothetical protein